MIGIPALYWDHLLSAYSEECKAMKQKAKGSERKGKGSQRSRSERGNTRSVTEPDRLSSQLERVLSLIRAHPGIRPSEINRLLNLRQSDGLRNTLIRRGLIRKEKDGSAVKYYVL